MLLLRSLDIRQGCAVREAGTSAAARAACLEFATEVRMAPISPPESTSHSMYRAATVLAAPTVARMEVKAKRLSGPLTVPACGLSRLGSQEPTAGPFDIGFGHLILGSIVL
jgi:hypothetical protein